MDVVVVDVFNLMLVLSFSNARNNISLSHSVFLSIEIIDTTFLHHFLE